MSDIRSPWPYPHVLAHRCGGTLAPENTLAGLDVAVRHGCGGVEFDVMLNGSGSAILIHDETLERTTNGRGPVAELDDARMRALDAGSWFGPAFAGERLPTFEEAAVACRRLGLAANVEIKPFPGMEARTGQVVADLTRRFWDGAALLPILSSFSEEALMAARDTAPELPRGLLVDEVPDDWLARCRRLGVSALHANTRHLDRKTVRAVCEAGLWLAVYTENDPARARELRAWGVDAVITDRPDMVAE
ncbi:MAG: glycerophosphodiester phosphodiesterase [Rhodocyclaceae bacterium]